MKSVLIACSTDWLGVGRLPSTLAREGLAVDLLDRGATLASESSHLRERFQVTGGKEAIANRLLELSGSYDCVIPCDEHLLGALLTLEDPCVDALLPAPHQVLDILMDKTRFPRAAEGAGLSVPEWRSATSAEEAGRAAEALGGTVVVKGVHGLGGSAVRVARDGEEAVAAARELGGVVVVEREIEGVLGLMPCLFNCGILVAALAGEKRRTLGRLGYSTVNIMWRVPDALVEMAQRAGAAFQLHGFVSFDYFLVPGEVPPVVLEINPRPVAQLHLGRRYGVDMGRALLDTLSDNVADAPRLPSRGGTAVLFPQELVRLRADQGDSRGVLSWALTPGSLRDVPWEDRGLLRCHVRREFR